jgi:hypothetical protein
VSRAQLHALGLGRGAIEHRIRRRRLHIVASKVYAVGHPVLSREARWMAAVLAAGAGGVLSHWSAASLWGLRAGAGPRSHVTTPRKRCSTPAIAFHNGTLQGDEVTACIGIPVTSPGRVVLDMASHLAVPQLHRVLEAAERLRPWHGPSVPDLIARYPRRAGTSKLRSILRAPLAMTRSDLEACFLHLIDRWGLPRPRMNISILGFEVDCVWPEQRLIVELDGFGTHGSRSAFERDRRRDRALEAAGWTVVRITATQLAEEPGALRADLMQLLRA